MPNTQTQPTGPTGPPSQDVPVRHRARYVVVGDGPDSHRIIVDGEITVQGDTVLAVGRRAAAASSDADAAPAGRVVEHGHALLSPGFVDLNALGEIDHAIFDSFQDRPLRDGLVWGERYLPNRTDFFAGEAGRLSRRHAFAQLLRNGITTAVPIGAEVHTAWDERPETIRDAIAEGVWLGLRLVIGKMYRSAAPYLTAAGHRTWLWDEAAGQRGLDEAVELALEIAARAHPLVSPMLAPARIETQTLDVLRATAAASSQHGLPVRLHAAQSLSEVRELEQRHGLRPVELLDRMGLLGERLSVPHAYLVDGHSDLRTATSGRDLERLAESGTTVTFCPLPSAYYSGTLESLDRYRAAGVNLAMGTDAAPPNMVKALGLGMALTKEKERSVTAGSPASLYLAATRGGARALGRPDLGVLEPGSRADFFVLDLDGPHLGPVEDPIRSLVHLADGRDIREVYVAGERVVAQGDVVGYDHEALRPRVQQLFDAYVRSHTDRDQLGRAPEELFPPSFPMG